MTEEERNHLRAKLVLMETDIRQFNHKTDGTSWAVCKLGKSYFRFEAEFNRCFYATEDEALEAGLKLLLSGAELTIIGSGWDQ